MTRRNKTSATSSKVNRTTHYTCSVFSRVICKYYLQMNRLNTDVLVPCNTLD